MVINNYNCNVCPCTYHKYSMVIYLVSIPVMSVPVRLGLPHYETPAHVYPRRRSGLCPSSRTSPQSHFPASNPIPDLLLTLSRVSPLVPAAAASLHTVLSTKHIHNLPQQMIFCIRRNCILDFRYIYRVSTKKRSFTLEGRSTYKF